MVFRKLPFSTLYFLILYINDLPNASELTERLLFADYISIFILSLQPKYLRSVLNNELKNNIVWLRCKKSIGEYREND